MPRGRPPGSGSSALGLSSAYAPYVDAKPKTKQSAFAFFVQLCRNEHKRIHPDETIEFNLLMKKCADRWKTMTSQEKARFHKVSKGIKGRRF